MKAFYLTWKGPPKVSMKSQYFFSRVPQNAAQAAAWHLTDKLSWQKLASKDRIRLSNGFRKKYFTPREMALAIRIAREANRRSARQRKDIPSNAAAKAESLSAE